MRFFSFWGVSALVGFGAISSCTSNESGRVGDASVDGGSALGSADADQVKKVHCSADLHSVLDESGAEIARCTDSQGCLDGACVKACDAALGNKSSVGCDFLTFSPPHAGSSETSCFAAFVANTWGADVTLSVSRGADLPLDSFAYLTKGAGESISYEPLKGGVIPAGQVAIVFLSDELGSGCPGKTKPALVKTAIVGTGTAPAFRLKTSAPVVAYDMFPYGGGVSAIASATLLLPVSAWGTNYMGTTAWEANGGGKPWLALVASEDGTDVTFSPKVAIEGGPGVSGSPGAVTATYSLSAGSVIKFEQTADLVGMPIKANKPIAVWGGNTCAQVPTGVRACDSMHQQLPPIRALGSRYAAVRYRDRIDGKAESPPFRIIGAVDGTKLKFTPDIGFVATEIDSGRVVGFQTSEPFVVESQDEAHPFYLAGYMTGCDGLNLASDCRGDPEFVNAVPAAQYLGSYTFFTDPTYPETNLVFVRQQASDGTFHEVELDCLGVVSNWTSIAGTAFQWARVDLVRGNFEPQGKCNNGLHVAKSDAPFGLTVWGWGSKATKATSTAVSYAYPAGANVASINTVVVDPVVR